MKVHEKRLVLSSFALVAIALIGVGIARAGRGQNIHASHGVQGQTQIALPSPIADGATNPDAVPDLIAYEILLNSIAEGNGAGELDRLRADVLAKQTKLSAEKVELLKQHASNFQLEIRALDTEVEELKKAHWPKPSPAVMNQLAALQKQKEAILDRVIHAYLARLSDEEKQQFNARLMEIKRNVKVYPEPPIEVYQHK